MIRQFITAFSVLFFSSTAYAFDPCDSSDTTSYTPIADRYETGLMFKIVSCTSDPSYIMGTIHSDSPQIAALAKDAAFMMVKDTERAGFEFITPENAAEITQSFMFYPADSKQTLASEMGKEWFSKARTLMQREKNIPMANVLRMRPWAAAVFLSLPNGTHDGVILDDRLKHAAEKSNKILFGLETMKEQFSLFHRMPKPLQKTMLKDTITSFYDIRQMNRDLQKAYLAQDLSRILELGAGSMQQTTDDALRDYLQLHLIDKRNHTMAMRMQQPLKEGKAFIAVGALHLPGETGILAKLEGLGYYLFAEPFTVEAPTDASPEATEPR